jgi:hypothetical protein
MRIYHPMNMDCMVDIAKALKIVGDTVRKMGAMMDPDIAVMSHDITDDEDKLCPTVSLKITFRQSQLREYIAQLPPQEGCNG